MFNVKAVQGGDYIRLLSAGFLHAGWEHLIFNMISLFFFHKVILVGMGVDVFMLIYIGAIVFGNLFAYISIGISLIIPLLGHLEEFLELSLLP